MILSELLRKWFNLPKEPCTTCNVLSIMNDRLERENHNLMHELLERSKPAPPVQEPVRTEELKPIMPQHVPWRVKQQMLEAEDRQKAALLKNRVKEISELEKELGIPDPMSDRNLLEIEK